MFRPLGYPHRRTQPGLSLLLAAVLVLVCCNKNASSSAPWKKVNKAYTGPLRSIAFADPQNGLIAAGTIQTDTLHTILLHTTDGGDSWITDTCTAEGFAINAVQSFNGYYYAFGSTPGHAGQVRRSNDLGKTWQPFSGDARGPVYFSDATTGILADGYTLYTIDGDGSIEPVYQDPAYTSFQQIQFLDSGIGFAGGRNPDVPNMGGVLAKTTDSGQHWQRLNNLPSGGLQTFRFINRDTGYAFTYPDVVSRTTDGGLTWTGAGLTPADRFTNIFKDGLFSSFTEGYALLSNDVYHTTDAGKTWSIQFHNQTASRHSLMQLYVSPFTKTMFVIGDQGEIIHY